MKSLIVGLLAVSALAGCKDKRPEWVDPQSLQPGPARGQLTPAQLERVEKLQKTFADVDPTPLKKWVEDFSRDLNPDRELAIYEGMAHAYSGYCTGRALSQEAKNDVYAVVMLRSGAPDAEVLPRLKLSALSLDDAKEILRLYTVAPAPISVTEVPQ